MVSNDRLFQRECLIAHFSLKVCVEIFSCIFILKAKYDKVDSLQEYVQMRNAHIDMFLLIQKHQFAKDSSRAFVLMEMRSLSCRLGSTMLMSICI